MNVYLISQSVNTGYDTYDSAVVIADSEDEARFMNPNCVNGFGFEEWKREFDGAWCPLPSHVNVELIGTASVGVKKGFVLKSFNAG